MNRRMIKAGVISGFLTAALFALPIYFSLNVWENYGWWLLGGVPFFVGVVAPIFLGTDHRVSHAEAFSAGMIALGTLSLITLAFLWEGLICLIMAACPAACFVMIGSAIGRVIQNRRVDSSDRVNLSWAVLGLPLALTALAGEPNVWDRRTVVSEVWIDAPPEKVWPLVLNCESFGEPNFWLFRAGVAHPISTRTEGSRRFCVLSTGEMPERVTRREEYRRLTFEVIKTPPSMKELNPFGQVKAHHDEDVYRSFTGDWQLIPERGGTRIVATSVYGHRLGANEFWRLWTDEIVHQVHYRVLWHMKSVSEQNSRP